MKDTKITAIILAAGRGARMNSSVTKQRMLICGKSVLARSVRAFDECKSVTDIIIVSRRDEVELVRGSVAASTRTPTRVVCGGDSRVESARLGFLAAGDNSDFVAIHDAARCLITPEMIERVISAAMISGAATAATPLTDTLKRADFRGDIIETLPRRNLYLAQTPQVFSSDIYNRALREEIDTNIEITDDNMLAEMIGANVRLVDTGRENIKITTPEDIEYAEFIIRKREKMTEGYRIGHGYDVHRFAEGRALILGGVNIPYEKGLLGHSDADVLVHAIMDSLLGAAALGDIGKHFPDSLDEYKGISSILLLERVAALISEAGYTVVNVDATVVMQKPKLLPYIEEMVKNIAEAISVPPESVNVKATTEEHLGFTGSGEGASAHAVAMLKK